MILPKISGYVKTFKDEDEDKNNDNNKLISLHIDKDKLWKNIKPFGLGLKI